MRICLVCTEKLPLPPVRGGAIQTYIDGVLPWLGGAHQVTVVGRSDPALPAFEERDGVRYVRIDPGAGPPDYCRNAAAWLRGETFDLVEVFNRPAFVPELSQAAPGSRFLLSLHNEMMNPDRIAADGARAVLERVDGVACISDYIRRGVAAWYPEYIPKLRTIRSGVDTVRFRPGRDDPGARAEARRRLGLPEDRPVILHVSRLSARKGNHLLLDAMSEVLPAHPGAVLLVVGSRWYGTDDDDEYTLALRERARAELGDAVRFTGFVPPPGIPACYLAGDLFVCASQWQEPLARVHYEAMAAGLPIITTDRGGNAEVLEEEGNGLIARPHDAPAAFAGCIRRLLNDPSLCRQMGRRGRELALERYTFDRVARELLALFEGR